ncbi:L-ascorbate metabolism protein UlaG (beta-lactamase superfamily) [Actinoplanes lutulentus]|uniref:L-ascorbate metabolism protein UlaG (Beta-lactamase superfamily) n=1 Tax=Actinoplanes lutulentus TaxID=1287878 RepID=A0A327YZ82_9ACTN|nr:L-ascorbate metabolism protein UlaG (beta-lactamase superfamily) [Actinoplanes lutulentus]
MNLRITHIGGPTALIEIDGVRLLTDPTFDDPGRRYAFGLGTSSVKVAGPALRPGELGRIDGVLLSHDHHADNLDDAGRALLPSVPVVVTTVSGAGRLGSSCKAVGLAPWESASVAGLEITATPARHGPPLSRALVGDAIGFAIRPPGSSSVIWMTGDTVLFSGAREVASRFTVDTVLLHLGKVQFGLTGPIKYTMNGRDAAQLIAELKPRRVVPVHYEGWSHFHEGRAEAEAAFPPSTLTWLTPGIAETV